ncbi:ABC transporter substrate-binding protein [Pseudobacillus sp. FSL P4-0506]|uniref:ABC transporter substrate-binding protein n=1 Tax=unclassified Pseudobacillus TaxID=2619284 RepID=UPI0030FB20EC
MQRKGNLAFVLLSAFLLFIFAGCSGKKDAGSENGGKDSENGGTVTIGIAQDAVAIDPAFSYDFATGPVVNSITEGLLKFDKNGELLPNLAKEWENPDEKTYIYHIRDDVTFSDGSPMTMEDVMFSMERIKDPATASYVGWMYENVEKIEQDGDWTIKVTLSEPDALWQYVPATTAGHVISKKYFEEHKENFGKPEGGLLGTGSFKFVSWQTGSEIVLEKNENYWNKEGGPYVDKAVFKVIPEGTTRITGLKTGQLNIATELPLDLVEKIKEMDNVRLDTSDSYLIDGIEFNTQRKPFDDPKVRQAMNYALDKDKILKQIVKDAGIPAEGSTVPPVMWTFSKDKWEAAKKELPDYSSNIKKAKKLLAESSVPNGFKATISTDGDSLRMNAALALQAAVKPLGIELEVEKLTGEELMTRTFGGARDYDIAVQNWGSDFPDPSGNLSPLFHSANTADGGANYANYKNPEVDKLLEEQNKLIDHDKRAELMIQAQKIIAEDSPWITLSHQKQMMAMTNNVEGYHITPLWYWDDILKNIKLK